MPSTYTTNNGIELIGTGEQSGTWGDTTNTNFELIDTALDGQATITLAATGTTGSPNTLDISDGTTSDGRNRVVVFDDGGDLGGTAYVQLTPNNAEKVMFVRNSLSGGQSISFFQGTYNASNDFVLLNGKDAIIKFDGGGTGAVVSPVLADLYLDSADINGGTIDGTVIGGTTPAAISGTTGQFDTSLNVDGTITSDGLSVGGSTDNAQYAELSSSGLRALRLSSFANNGNDNAGHDINASSSLGAVTLSTGGTTRFKVDAGGDISFYEDTGTTPKFFWDASAERLGIGTGSPLTPLHIKDSSPIITIEDTDAGGAYSTVSGNGTEGRLVISADATNSAAGSYTSFRVDGSEAMRIDSSGNVGIGTSSPGEKLDIQDGSVRTKISLGTTEDHHTFANNGGTRYGGVGLFTGSADLYLEDDTGERITFDRSANAVIFTTNNSQAMRIDSSGRLLVGTTSINVSAGGLTGVELVPDGAVVSSRDGGPAAIFNRETSDGEVIRLRKDGTTVGTIGVDSSRVTLDSATRTWFWGSSNYFVTADNVVDLGSPSYRFDDIYATNGTIQTSDRNEKQDIAELDEAERRVAVAAKGLIRKYRWKSAVEEKGDDARIHVGIIAQDLQAAFEAEGLDAGRYAMFISSTWWEAEKTYTDDDGVEQTRTVTYETAEEAPADAVERTRLGVRYPELLAFIIGAL